MFWGLWRCFPSTFVYIHMYQFVVAFTNLFVDFILSFNAQSDWVYYIISYLYTMDEYPLNINTLCPGQKFTYSRMCRMWLNFFWSPHFHTFLGLRCNEEQKLPTLRKACLHIYAAYRTCACSTQRSFNGVLKGHLSWPDTLVDIINGLIKLNTVCDMIKLWTTYFTELNVPPPPPPPPSKS